MKLSICLLLAVVAAASADQGYYQQQHVTPSVSQAVSSSYSHYDYDYQPPQKEGYVTLLFTRLAFVRAKEPGDITVHR